MIDAPHIIGPGSPWAVCARGARKLQAKPAPVPRYPTWAFDTQLWRLAALLPHPVVGSPTDEDSPCHGHDLHVLSVRARADGELIASHYPLHPGRCPMAGRRAVWRRLNRLPERQ